MNDTTYTHESSGTVFILKSITEEQLLDFFTTESAYHIAQGTQEDNAMYLNVIDNTFTLTELTGVYHEDVMVAFCIVPKYDKTVLMRIYTTPQYRCMGIASFLIEHKQSLNLSCLKDNVPAMTLYRKLGFNTVREHTWIVELRREL